MAMMGQQWKAMIKMYMGIRLKPPQIRLSREKMVVGVLDVNIVFSYFCIVFKYLCFMHLTFGPMTYLTLVKFRIACDVHPSYCEGIISIG
jgi:hypothetical protein